MSVKVILRKTKPDASGACPLALQIIKDRKATMIHLGYRILPDQWDGHEVKRNHPNSKRLNNFIAKRKSELMETTIELETIKPEVSSKAVKATTRKKHTTFAPVAAEYLNECGYNQRTADKPRIKRFLAFVNGDIMFSEVTPALLTRFKSSLKVLNISERTMVNHLAAIRSVFGLAIRDKVIDRKNSPFSEIKIEFPETTKIGLERDELKRLEAVTLDQPRHNHARNLWLFSFYFAGMRVSDVLRLKWSDFQNNRLYYSMGKNDKVVTLPVHAKAQAILDQYDRESELVFPELRKCDLKDAFITQRTIAFSASAIDKVLRLHVAPAAVISKKLTMHIARHTFGHLSGDTISPQMLQKLYRHSDIKTTIGYQSNFINKDADDSLNLVID